MKFEELLSFIELKNMNYSDTLIAEMTYGSGGRQLRYIKIKGTGCNAIVVYSITDGKYAMHHADITFDRSYSNSLDEVFIKGARISQIVDYVLR